MTAITKTEARHLARAARRFGYYQDGTALSASCPTCRAQITTGRNYGYKPVPKGKPYSEIINGRRCAFRQESVTEALGRAMIAHLTSDCPGGAR